MTQSAARTAGFLLGLLGFRATELLKPDHGATAPLRRRWLTNLSFGVVNGAIVSLVCASCFVLTARGVFPAGFAPEVVISSAVKVSAVVALGISPAGLVAFESVMLACAQFQHANIRPPGRVESVLWWTFVPPAMHRIHHTPNLADTGSNFGTIVTAWDWLLGTLRKRPPPQMAIFGVPELRDPDRLGLLALAFLPLRVHGPRSTLPRE